MATESRVQRLRDMVDKIERLPESPERDRLLSEVRSRAVDVDTGVTPRAMLPLREPEPAPELTRLERHEEARIIRRVVPRTPAPVVEPERPRSAVGPAKTAEHSFLLDDYLSLDDTPPLPDVRVRGDLTAPPWTFGLRG